MLARSGDTEHLVAEESLDQEEGLNILWAVTALTAGGSFRIEEIGELTLPISERVDFDARDETCRADRYGALACFAA